MKAGLLPLLVAGGGGHGHFFLRTGSLFGSAYSIFSSPSSLSTGLTHSSRILGSGIDSSRIGQGGGYKDRVVMMAVTKKKKGSSGGGGGGGGGGAVKTVKVASGGFGVKERRMTPAEEMVVKAMKRIKRDSTDAKAWFMLGSGMAQQEEYAEARQILQMGISHCPEDKTMPAALGAMLRQQPTLTSDIINKDVTAATEGQEDWLWKPNLPAYSKKRDEDFIRYSVPRPPPTDHRGFSHSSGEGIIFASKGPIIDPDECKWVIQQVENHVGWGDKDTAKIWENKFPARLWLREVPGGVKQWFDNRCKTQLFPMLQSLYPHMIRSPDDIRCHDAFIVCYDGEGRLGPSELATHQDETTFSFTIALNGQDQYTEGGTYFPELRRYVPEGTTTEGDDAVDQDFHGTSLNAPAGGVCTFPGMCRHGGRRVTSGRRYIIPLFIFLDVNMSGRERGYKLREMGYEHDFVID